MDPLPDDALVVRGGRNLPDDFANASGASVDPRGFLQGVSVNCAPGRTVGELTAPHTTTGYPGIPHTQIGVTKVGEVRAAGGEVTPAPSRTNPYHATLNGLTAEEASRLFQPTMKNPSRLRQ